jgi:hypothetical protein
MTFEYRRGLKGPFTKGMIDGWDYSREGGGYRKGSGFFSVHWEVHDHDPDAVKLHVEAPRAADDKTLNSLKQQVMQALLSSAIDDSVRSQGFDFQWGSRVSVEATERFKSSEAFRVLLRDQRDSTHEDNLKKVHQVIGPELFRLIQRFAAPIGNEFR